MSNFGPDFDPDDVAPRAPEPIEPEYVGTRRADVPPVGPDEGILPLSAIGGVSGGLSGGLSGDVPAADPPRSGSRRAERTQRRGRGCLPMLLVLVIILVVAWFGGGWALDKIKSLTGDSPDYSGSGTGSVVVQVHEGDSSAAIGQTLKSQGVVKSVQAFIDAANGNSRSKGIQVGYYRMREKMKATAALAVLIDPANLIQTRVTIPEGFRVKDIVKTIVAKTDLSRAKVEAALHDTKALGLPSEAGGNPEGYLFPATYDVLPGETAATLLKQMVDKGKQEEASLGVAAKAAAVGLTPHQVITLASILEYEGSRDQDYPKIAEAIYNRLKIGMRLQSDATVAYANNLSGTVYTTSAQRENPSPYNTYVHAGLPPGPIGSPGEATIKAALNPVKGPWLYWVVVNLRTGETRFATTYAEHQANVALLHQYCETSSAC
ncbi:MAG TPA: endolytic transglycosylase MltG [Marmoricola sp.]|nr:endolytic transglycosylase MltG [Marmoricola sp.]